MAKGQLCREHKPVKLYSLRQKFCVTVLCRQLTVSRWSRLLESGRWEPFRGAGEEGDTLDLVRAVLPVDDVPASRERILESASPSSAACSCQEGQSRRVPDDIVGLHLARGSRLESGEVGECEMSDSTTKESKRRSRRRLCWRSAVRSSRLGKETVDCPC
mgnify:CR=1 FL=1